MFATTQARYASGAERRLSQLNKPSTDLCAYAGVRADANEQPQAGRARPGAVDQGRQVGDVGKSELLAGKSMWTLQAQPDAPIDEGEIEAVLVTHNGILQTSARVRVVAPPKPAKRNQTDKQVPEKGPNIVWVTREE